MTTIGSNFKIKVEPQPQKSTAFRHTSVSFGDGYEQRSKSGINAIKDTWQIVFTANEAEKNNLETILREAAGVTPVQWQAPDATAPKQWLVRSYQVIRISSDLFEISCAFELLNEP